MGSETDFDPGSEARFPLHRQLPQPKPRSSARLHGRLPSAAHCSRRARQGEPDL